MPLSTHAPPARLIIDGPGSGSWNMAVDAAILKSLALGDSPTLRFYRWSRPTLSLGYFQSLAERSRHRESHSIDVVRRATGGGAIVHDCELTYSLTMAASARSTGGSPWLYQTVHHAFIGALHSEGIIASRYGCPPAVRTGPEPFLCFQRRTPDDVVVSGYKILGSAQRRGANGLLQHGSLLLAASSYAPQLPGLVDLVGKSVTGQGDGSARLVQRSNWQDAVSSGLGQRLVAKLTAAIAREFKWDWRPGKMDPTEHALAERIEGERFSQLSWTGRK